MSHLPNEIWLHIASFSESRDLWLTLRPINRQLQQCVEQHFEREILPETVLSLPVIIPTYDVRVPIRGKVTFKPMSNSNAEAAQDFDRITFDMADTDPEYYRPHFLTRWATVQDRESGRLDDRRVRWEMELGGLRRGVNLHQSMAVRECKPDEVKVSFEWTYTVSSFFKSGSAPLW